MVDRAEIFKSLIVAFLALAIGLNGVVFADRAQAVPKTDKSFHVGVCTHFSQNKGIVEMNIRSMKNAGIDAIRDEVGWTSIEREKGKLAMPERLDHYVRSAAEAGLDVMLILDYSNPFYDDGDRPRSPEAVEGFCRYAEFVVRHFGKDVAFYEIWNEWDIGIGMRSPYNVGGSPEDYVKLLKAVYPRIKSAAPDVTVIGGASTSGGVKKGWLEKIIQLGALDYCDAVSIHSYNYSDKFPERSPEACSDWMTDVQKMLRKYNNDVEVPFYVTEMGWPTHVGRAGTEPELSASYLARLYLLARTSASFRGLWWYDFQDDGWKPDDNENNFGIVRPDLTAKPAYYVLSDISGLTTGGEFVDRLKTEDDNLRILRFRYKQSDFWAIWSSDDKTRQIILQAPKPSGYVTINQLGHKPYRSDWGFRDWVGRRGEFVPNRLSVVVGSRPFLMSGDLTDVSMIETIPR